MQDGYSTLVQQIFQKLNEIKSMIATAESCTGGLISAAITNENGSSTYFDRGFVTYSNQAKMEMLGVKKKTLQQFGAVSKETATEMAQGALQNSKADISVSVTGVAGPTGGTDEKPVGLVYIASLYNDNMICRKYLFENKGRAFIRQETVKSALSMILEQL